MKSRKVVVGKRAAYALHVETMDRSSDTMLGVLLSGVGDGSNDAGMGTDGPFSDAHVM